MTTAASPLNLDCETEHIRAEKAGGANQVPPALRFRSTVDLKGQSRSKSELPLREVRVGTGDHHEVGSSHTVIRVVEVWRVSEVERLRAELDLEPLGE